METRVFRMRGMAITSHSRFMEYFSPTDLLRGRELAAGFACQQSLRKLRARNWYCGMLLFQAVFNWKNNSGATLREPLDFFRVNTVHMGMQTRDARALNGYLDSCRRNPANDASLLLGGLWKIARETGLSGEEQKQLFYFLGAGYFLADKDLQEVPLTDWEAREAFLREDVREGIRKRISPMIGVREGTGEREEPIQAEMREGTGEPEEIFQAKMRENVSVWTESQPEKGGVAVDWLEFPEYGALRLPARTEPYRVLMGEVSGKGKGSSGSDGLDGDQTRGDCEIRIRPCKVEALPHRQGSTELPVILQMYRSEEDREPLEVDILPGDYRYFNCVGKRPFYLHPVTVEGDGCVMARVNDTIVIRDMEGRLIQEILTEGREIVSFAPERRGGGWVIGEPDSVDYSSYSMRDIYSPLVNGGIVELQIREHVLYALREDGTVYTQFSRGFPVASGVWRLEDWFELRGCE